MATEIDAPDARPEWESAAVELKRAVGHWEAGSVGAVVETYPYEALVEISDDEGRALDFVVVPYDALAVCAPSRQGRFSL